MKTMKIFSVRAFVVVLLAALSIAFCGCSTRSISNSGFDGGYRLYNPHYAGELTEFDVLGIDPGVNISDEDIAESLSSSRSVKLKKGDAIMLIQSGAMFPDEPMLDEFEKHFTTMSFSGIPLSRTDKSGSNSLNYGRGLRLAAAKGGNNIMICYWGILETTQRNLATRGVSWVPIVGRTIPDESQRMRIRLKLAVIDVATGNWFLFSPKPTEDSSISSRINRESSDQDQVALLKNQAYIDAVDKLVARYLD